jgi:hypothetical protein
MCSILDAEVIDDDGTNAGAATSQNSTSLVKINNHD